MAPVAPADSLVLNATAQQAQIADELTDANAGTGGESLYHRTLACQQIGFCS
jgi:hypothetical protein